MTIRMGEDMKKGKLTEVVSKNSVIIDELPAFYDHKKEAFLNWIMTNCSFSGVEQHKTGTTKILCWGKVSSAKFLISIMILWSDDYYMA